MSRRVIIWILFFLAVPVPMVSVGPELSSYSEKLEVLEDGSARVRLEMTVTAGGGEELRIPVYSGIRPDPVVDGLSPEAVQMEAGDGVRFLRLDIAGIAEYPLRVVLSYFVKDFFDKSLELQYRFMNMSFHRIDRFSATVFLPDGFAVKTIDRFAPKPKNKGASSLYSLTRIDGRRALSIQLSDVKLGEEIALSGTVFPEKKSRILMFFLIIFAIIYLIFFRDVLKNGGKEKLIRERK